MKHESPIFNTVVLLLLLTGQAISIAWLGYRHSPVIDEVGHLPAGIYHWDFGQFDLYRVNPPLVRTIAATPAVLSSAERDWSNYSRGLTARPEWRLGNDFIKANPSEWIWYFILARWALIPFMLLGGVICYLWSKDLYGHTSGLIACSLWCFSPNIMAWGATITPDASAASLGVLAGYCFWKWLCRPNWNQAILAGFTLGLVELTKTTWVILFGLWPVLWLFWQATKKEKPQSVLKSRQLRQLGIILILGLYLLNLGYFFTGSFQQLKSFQFASRSLAGDDSLVEGGYGGNRFSESWLGEIPVPVPQDYLAGIDFQKSDFEMRRWSYLNGEWRLGGWWYYYIVGLLLKVPTGTLVLFLLALYITCRKSHVFRSDWKNELILLTPAIVVFVLVSSQTGFSRYLRYLLPCFPMVFIWISKVGRSIDLRQWQLAVPVCVALLWSIGSSLWIYPHSLSYFNEFANGPTGGHRYLIDANIDWGQNLFYLKEWYDDHPKARPLQTRLVSSVDTESLGIPRVPIDSIRSTQIKSGESISQIPRPGWYAISVHHLHDKEGIHEYFLKHSRPIAMVGYSIYIYHITQDEVNRAHSTAGS